MSTSKAKRLLIAMAALTTSVYAQALRPAKLSGGGTACQPFTPGIFYPEKNSPEVLTGDVNGDGIPDLVAVDWYSTGVVTVYIGQGNGKFKPGATFPAGGNPGAAVLADFDKDGKLDIAVAVSGATSTSKATVNVFLGNGNGSFQTTPLKSPIKPGTLFLAAADFNGDGKLDLASLNNVGPGPNPVLVSLGNGDGTFQAGVSYAVGTLPSAIAVADFNGDGKLDMAVANGGFYGAPGTVSILLGKGDGSFSPQTIFPSGGLQAFGITAADLNGDGKLDLAVVNYYSGTTTVFFGNGDGTFGIPASYATGHAQAPYRIAAVSFDKGEKPGLAVSTLAGIVTFVNQGNGTFGIGRMFNPPSGSALAVADFDGDGKPDLAFGAGEFKNGDSVAVLLGKGHGEFATSAAYLGIPNLNSIGEGDFNGDGIPDLAVGDLDAPFYVGIMLGDGRGGFTPGTNNQFTAGDGVTGIAVGDLNGDGKADLALALFTGEVQVFLGNGDGTFSKGGTFDVYQKSLTTFGFIQLADFNGDGKLDAAVTSQGPPGVVSILLGNGDGTFQSAVPYAIEPGTTVALEGLAIADFNGDGKLDFAVNDNSLGMMRVFLGNGDGSFRTGPQAPIPSFAYGLAVADFNGDGKLDVAVGSTSVMQILLGNGDGSFHPGITLNAPASVPVAADFNGDGKMDVAAVVNLNVMDFFPGKGDGTFGPAATSFVSDGATPFVVGDFNGDGAPDLAAGGSSGGVVSVLLNACGSRQPALKK